MTQELQIANSLIEASEALRRLFPDTYDEQSREVQGCIRKVMEAQQMDVLPATLMLMGAAQEKGREADIHWFAAAAVDMLCGQQPHESPRSKLLKMAESFKL
jgi:hypothetical protein